MFGLVLVIIGIFFLLKNAGIIEGSLWGYLWPILIIFLGLSIVDKDKKKKGDYWCFWCSPKRRDKNHDVVDRK